MNSGTAVVDDDGVVAVGGCDESAGGVRVPGGHRQAADILRIASAAEQFGTACGIEHRGGQVHRRSHPLADQLDINHLAAKCSKPVPVFLVRLNQQPAGLAGGLDLLGVFG